MRGKQTLVGGFKCEDYFFGLMERIAYLEELFNDIENKNGIL